MNNIHFGVKKSQTNEDLQFLYQLLCSGQQCRKNVLQLINIFLINQLVCLKKTAANPHIGDIEPID